MASIKFYANISDPTPSDTIILHNEGEGLGFYGLGFGQSVPVGDTQDSTYVVDANGVNQITGKTAPLSNTKMISVGTGTESGTTEAGQVQITGNNTIPLNQLPNYLCPLRVSFENDEAVRVTNCKLRIFDRTNPDNQAPGVRTYVYEARHPVAAFDSGTPQLNMRGRPANSWVTFGEGITTIDGTDIGSNVLEMPLTPSPGLNGENSDGADESGAGATSDEGSLHTSTQHDWYIAISASPTTIGSKIDYGMFVTLEYLS